MFKALFQNKRYLAQILILSIALNAILAAIFFYFFIRGNPFLLSFEYTPLPVTAEKHFTNNEQLARLSGESFPTLLSSLTNTRLFEDGYRQRDLALGALVAKHHFDINRALGTTRLARRTVGEISLFPGLNDADFAKILHFAQVERYPYTSEGLFVHLRENKTDPDLLLAFLRTPEFHLMETLFARAGLPIKKKFLIALCLESSWSTLNPLFEKMRADGNFAETRRRELLLMLMQEGSRNAAHLLLITDGAFAAKQLDDSSVIRILDLTEQQTDESMAFAKAIYASPRSDAVRLKAKATLIKYLGLKTR